MAADGGEQFSARVVGITDGDTITVLRGGNEQVKVRLEGIDTPERGEPFSAQAKRFISSLVFGKQVGIQVKELDRYGRTVARVIVDGTDTSLALVQAGLAWHYTRYSDDADLARGENVAKSAGIGLWSLPNPAPPWGLRQRQQSAANASRSSEDVEYHGNRNSNVFHAPWCRYYSCKNCTAKFKSRAEAVAAGYRPGGICNP